MTTLSCTTKTWDSIRPASVKKTGLGEAITKTLKALPGGDPKKLANADACEKAAAAIDSLIDTLTSAANAVAKAKDDKKGAAAQLKEWKTEAGKVKTEISERHASLIEGPLGEIVKKWSGPRKDLEKKVQDLTEQIREVDQNVGHSEQMRQECFMQMSKRAGELRKQGMGGTEPKDFLGDHEFKAAYDLWDDMVETMIKATKKHEIVATQSKQLRKLISDMYNEIEAAAKSAGDALKVDSKGVKAFVDFRADATSFAKAAVNGEGNKYTTFAFLPDMDAASSIRGKQEKLLSDNFKRLGPDQAEKYFDETMGMHGLSDKQLKKTMENVRIAKEQIEKIAKSGQQNPQVAEKLQTIVKTLSEKSRQLQLGRTSKDIVQALSHNEDKKKELDRALEYIVSTTKELEKTVLELV